MQKKEELLLTKFKLHLNACSNRAMKFGDVNDKGSEITN
jgi:hypothetical protein